MNIYIVCYLDKEFKKKRYITVMCEGKLSKEDIQEVKNIEWIKSIEDVDEMKRNIKKRRIKNETKNMEATNARKATSC